MTTTTILDVVIPILDVVKHMLDIVIFLFNYCLYIDTCLMLTLLIILDY